MDKGIDEIVDVLEGNPYHKPKGPGGGQFTGKGAGGGAVGQFAGKGEGKNPKHIAGDKYDQPGYKFGSDLKNVPVRGLPSMKTVHKPSFIAGGKEADGMMREKPRSDVIVKFNRDSKNTKGMGNKELSKLAGFRAALTGEA